LSQLPLDFGVDPSYAAEDFLVAASNAAAFAWVERWPEWPAPALAIHGPPGCGKTHLAHVWRARAGAVLIDAAQLVQIGPPALMAAARACAIDKLPEGELAADFERALLHLYNLAAERGGHLLLCAPRPPARWGIALPDLRSRLAALPAIAIEPPDDGLLEALLAKLFADRQLAVDRGTIIYIVTHMERSFDAARRVVELIDRTALATRRRPSLGLVREILDQAPFGAGEGRGST
jgi:chromosomal replication initiation ATPase DnaA